MQVMIRLLCIFQCTLFLCHVFVCVCVGSGALYNKPILFPGQRRLNQGSFVLLVLHCLLFSGLCSVCIVF